MIRTVAALAIFCIPLTQHAQSAVSTPSAGRTITIRGIVRGKVNRPLVGIIVVDALTLEGARTDTLGNFRLTVPQNDSVVLTMRAIGYHPLQRTLLRGTWSDTSVALTLDALPPQLSAITVAASQYVASTERTATLTPLQVATTPGSNADVNRAIQTLPGVQLADEGNGITTRGGDVTETRAFIDGAPLFNTIETVTPAGSVAATVNPFLLDRISFSSGGFDVRRGNTMSGIIDLYSQARPAASFVNGNLSMAGAALSAGLTLPHRIGIAGTISRNTIAPITAVNGNPRGFEPVPNGGTLSGNVGWAYRKTGSVKLFALRQTNTLGINIGDSEGGFAFRTNRNTHIAVVSLNDSTEKFTLFANASSSGLIRNEDFGAAALGTTLHSLQSLLRLEWRPITRLEWRAGAEIERLAAQFFAQVTDSTNAARAVADFDRAEVRGALFGEMSIALRDSLRVTAGVRREASGFATSPVLDPRLSFAWMPTPQVAITAAWGWFSQLADPTYLARGLGATNTLPFQRARHAIVGAQFSTRANFLRAELWQKSWTNLVQLDPAFRARRNGRGDAIGVDLFARRRNVLGAEWRATYSFIRARRTDPRTGLIVRSPSDITHTATLIADWALSRNVTINVGSRFATGRPYTDITGSDDAGGSMRTPIYAASFAQRLAPIARTDLSISRTMTVGPRGFGVVFAGVGNVFNRRNTQDVIWNRDFSQRQFVQSVFVRSLFVGCNLAITARQP